MFLKTEALDAGYGFLQILRDVNICLEEGEFSCLLGPNGTGKTTTLKTIAGLIKPMKGKVIFNGQEIGGLAGNKVVQKGVVYVSEALNLFTNMSVHDNLLMGAFTVKDHEKIKKRLDYVYDLFQRLKQRHGQLAGTMSGGERKMLAIARGLMSYPKVILVDEPSFGLSPQMTDVVFDALDVLNREQNLTVLVVEQNATKTLEATKNGYVMENGVIVMSGASKDLLADEGIQKTYLGL
ncbi:MAG: ABC transporter ATP-binding protein [Deltaproteobacteria bacterium]|jgi:branched-chain amino acid transport system ATP-binding protein|nr:ABC transporter ATP-binding protein [Deltaproteobacteria bacterium]